MIEERTCTSYYTRTLKDGRVVTRARTVKYMAKTAPRPIIAEDTKAKIIALHADGVPKTIIGRKFDISVKRINTVLRDHAKALADNQSIKDVLSHQQPSVAVAEQRSARSAMSFATNSTVPSSPPNVSHHPQPTSAY